MEGKLATRKIGSVPINMGVEEYKKRPGISQNSSESD
jgi:hypothetical protein